MDQVPCLPMKYTGDIWAWNPTEREQQGGKETAIGHHHASPLKERGRGGGGEGRSAPTTTDIVGTFQTRAVVGPQLFLLVSNPTFPKSLYDTMMFSGPW